MVSIIPKKGIRTMARRLVIAKGTRVVTQRERHTKKTAIALCPSGVKPCGVGSFKIPQKIRAITANEMNL